MKQIRLAILASALAGLLRWALEPLLGDSSQFALFYLAVLIAASFGGAGCALLAAALGATVGVLLFSHGPMDRHHLAGLALFLLFSATIVCLTGRLRRPHRLVENGKGQLAGSSGIMPERQRLANEERNLLREARTFVTHATATAPDGWDDPATTWGVERYRWEPDMVTTEVAQEVLPLYIRPGEDYYEAWLKARHPDDFVPTAAALTRAMRTGASSVRREFRVIDKHGRLHWMSQVCALEVVRHGCWRVTAINTDTSEVKQAEETLRERERFIHAMTQASPLCLYIFDFDIMGTSYMNRPILGDLGYPAELSERVKDLNAFRQVIAPEELPHLNRVMQEWRELTDAQVRDDEYVLRYADGMSRFFAGREIVFARRPDGSVRQVLGTLLDITARKLAEEAQRQRADEINRLIEAVPVAVCVSHDPHCRIITGNARANEYFEAAEGENVSASSVPGVRRFFSSGGRELVADELPMQVAAATNREVKDMEFDVLLPSGRRMTMLGGAVPLRNDEGSVRGCIATYTDISARKQMASELHYVLRQARTMITRSTVIATEGWDDPATTWGVERYQWMIEADDVAAALEVVPLDMQPGETFAAAWHRAKLPDDAPAMAANATAALRGGAAGFSQEFRVVDKDGKIRWLRQVNAVEIKGIGHWRITAINTDITEERRAEEALRQSEMRLRRMARDARCDLWQANVTGLPGWDTPRALDPESHLIQWGGTVQEPEAAIAVVDFDWPTGVSLEEAMYRSRLPEDNLQMYRTMVNALQSGQGTYQQEYRCRDRNGKVQWLFERTNVLTLSPGHWQISGVTINVSERKRAEQALEAVARQARCILNAGEVIAKPGWQDIALLPEQQPFDWSVNVVNVESAQQVLPLDIGTGTYQQAWWNSRHHEDDLQAKLNAGTAFLHGDSHYQNLFRCTDCYGNEHYMRQIVTVESVGEGHWRTFGIATDVTEERRAELALQASEREMKAALELAEQASKAKDHFLAVLSHELRTPLTPVATALEMLCGQSQLDESARRSLEMIHRNVVLEARLIDDLLDMTRIARGKIDLERRPIVLSEVIRRAMEVVGPDVEARHLHLRADFQACPCCVNGDATRLQQVFWNLLRNATKFTPHGGSIEISCHVESGRAMVEVRDSGVGIAAGDLGRIFAAFEQGERNSTRQFGGLGLGLTISKALVELHGGTIEALSEGIGKGSTFRVCLPMAASSAVSPATRPAALPAAVCSRRILLVEDHGDTARVMRQLLIRQGHTVQWAGDVATAHELAGKHHFDLMISDLGLPDGTGLELLSELRSRGWTVPAIALSGYGQEQDLERSRAAGFAVHLVKPASSRRLQEAITQVVEAGQAATSQ